MSWQAFVDTQLVASNHVTKAAIIGNVDGQVWASTPDFFPRGYPATIAKDDGSEVEETVNEAAILVQIMQTGKNHPQGLRMNGDKYQFIRGETDPNVVVTGKKGRVGIILSKTGAGFIVAIYDENLGHSSGNSMSVVEKLAEYMRENGC